MADVVTLEQLQAALAELKDVAAAEAIGRKILDKPRRKR